MRREVPSGQLSRTGGAEQHFRSHSQPACRAEPWEHDRGELADGIGYKGLRELLWGGLRLSHPPTHRHTIVVRLAVVGACVIMSRM